MNQGIDTNILVRLAANDDPKQVAKASRLLQTTFSKSSPAWISLIVVVEFTWVLRRLFKYTRKDISDSITQLLETDRFLVEGEDLVRVALQSYQSSKADFSDCLILARNLSRKISPTHTFDRKAAKLEGFQLLK